ncbi:MAG: type II secretion system protein [Planctomycetes bacterium]|nr:type II secretion system protein [Planctomycetota bacterium]
MGLQGRSRSQRGGFTLIELLVVMAIIATLAGIGMVGIPRIMRQADVTACKGHLDAVYKSLMIYQMNNKYFPRASGAEFVLAVWGSNIVDHTAKDAEIFFCPSMNLGPDSDLGNVTPEMISYTGPDQLGSRKGLAPQDRNANEKVIMCDKVPAGNGDKEHLDSLAHAAKGICFLTLGGATDYIDSSQFGTGQEADSYPIIGPESPLEKFQKLVVDEGN